MSNALTITGTAVTGDSTTVNFCTISGFIKDISGNNLGGYAIRLRYIFKPFVFGADTLLLKEFQTITADNNGKISFKLLQGSTVKVEIPGRVVDYARECLVPSEDTLSLIGFLFPYAKSVTFTTTTKTIAVDETYTPEGLVTLTDGTTLKLPEGATFVSSNTSVAVVSGNQIKGVSSGTATITVSSFDMSKTQETVDGYKTSISRLNVPAITNTNNLTITV